jgi:ribosomal protein L7/L12
VTSTTEMLVTRARETLSHGGDVEEVLALLRQSGCSKVESIKLLREIAGLGLGEAKRRVHLSETWRDRREADDELHASLERLARESEHAED